MPAFVNIAGARFGKLAVVTRHSVNGTGTVRWLCVCDCGAERVVSGDSLRRGVTTSCGCLQRELAAAKKRTHGLHGTPEYKAWDHIKDRCFNPGCDSYKDYGARGIMMCPEWRKSFDAFLAHVGPRPSAAHSIDRINNNGHYEPGNCRWATAAQQVRNRRNNRIVRYNGRIMTVADAADLCGLNRGSVYSRISRGMKPQDAFNHVLDWSNRHAS